MIRALLDGKKTQTRRLAIGGNGHPSQWVNAQPGDMIWVREAWRVSSGFDGTKPSKLPYDNGVTTLFEAGGCRARGFNGIYVNDPSWPTPSQIPDLVGSAGKLRPSMFLPMLASRMTLEVTEVRTQRLHDITPDDAVAEGLRQISKDDGRTCKYGIPDFDGLPGTDDIGWPWDQWRISPVDAFEHLWTRINGAESWASNPEIVAITFNVHHHNVLDVVAMRKSA